MTNRREFLQIGITATAWPLAATAAGAMPSATAEPLALYRVIYDDRFAQSVAFGQRAASRGLPVQAIAGDMTRFWYDDLYHAWQKGPAAIAGLTAHGPMFCFEQLARDRRMRLVFRAEHAFVEEGVAHTLRGPLSMLRDSLVLNEHRPDWAACMADVVVHCPRGRSEIAATSAVSPAGDVAPGADPEALYSWVIAPALRA